MPACQPAQVGQPWTSEGGPDQEYFSLSDGLADRQSLSLMIITLGVAWLSQNIPRQNSCNLCDARHS
jgi:hypothetical protein